jgi:Tfp pilus assembly protein PilE
MRGLGLIGVLLALLLVAWLAMRQSTSLTHLAAPRRRRAPAPAGGNVREQSQRIEQQFKQQLENALQTPRDAPDEAK